MDNARVLWGVFAGIYHLARIKIVSYNWERPRCPDGFSTQKRTKRDNDACSTGAPRDVARSAHGVKEEEGGDEDPLRSSFARYSRINEREIACKYIYDELFSVKVWALTHHREALGLNGVSSK